MLGKQGVSENWHLHELSGLAPALMNSAKFEDAYRALIKDDRTFEHSLKESASNIARQCAIALSVSRASIWLSGDDNSTLHCLSLYRADLDICESGAVISAESYPTYFAALDNERVIDAHNALEDPRTTELSQSYLAPLNIHSMLDATLRPQGKVKGVLCLEMVGHRRIWTTDEQMFVASVADLVSQKMIIDDLALSEGKYRSLFEHTDEGILLFSKFVFSDVNPAICKMYGETKENLLGKTPIHYSPEYQSDGQLSSTKAMEYINACLQGTPQNFEWTHIRRDGTEFYADVTLSAIEFAGEDTLYGLVRDITDKKVAAEQAQRAKEKLVFRAAHDSLTGLKNREQLHIHIDSIINENSDKSSQSQIALLLLDLNRFKEVNDTLGHSTGDKVLVKLAIILDERITAIGGSLFRLGGDEFVAVFDSEHCSEPLAQLDVILHRCLKTSIDIDDISIEMDASIGIALYPENGTDSHELLRCADVAMYQAKSIDGVSSWYNPQNDLNNKRRLAMIVELGSAISDNQLVLYFQPRIQIKTGDVTGCEALVRWQHPRHGLVPPGEFLPLAELSKLIHPLSEWVLHSVVKQIKTLVDMDYYVPIAMNVSARNLTDSQLVDKLQNLITLENIDPKLLEIEITESALINHPQRAVENLERLDKLGVHLAIDDFGTGYSSLGYLKKLPLNTLKIDRSFVKDLLTDGSDSVIVDSTIDLAHNFSLTVVAEGVEDQATLDELEARNCDQAQGFHIARPMPAEDFLSWLYNHFSEQKEIRKAS